MVLKPEPTVTDFALIIAEQNNQKDPDGDDVVFMYSYVSQIVGTIDDIIVSLDAQTRIFSVTYDFDMHGQFAIFTFWTEDPGGLRSAEFTIEFYYEST